jgi:hypothetical protein
MLLVPDEGILPNNRAGFHHSAIEERVSDEGRQVFRVEVRWHILGANDLNLKRVQVMTVHWLQQLLVANQL